MNWLNNVSCFILSANLIKSSVRLAARQGELQLTSNKFLRYWISSSFHITPYPSHTFLFSDPLHLFINVFKAAEALRVGRRVLQLAVPDDPGGQPAAERHCAGGRGLRRRHHTEESPGGRGLPPLTLPPLSRGHGAQTAAGSYGVELCV